MRYRVRGSRIGDERDVVSEIGGEPGRRFATLFRPDPADNQFTDSLRCQGLLQIRRGERVVRGLGQHRLASSWSQPVHQPDQAALGVEHGSRARFRMQHPDDQVARGPGHGHQTADLRDDPGLGDGSPAGTLAEGFLDIDDEKGSFHEPKSPPPPASPVRHHHAAMRNDPVTISGTD